MRKILIRRSLRQPQPLLREMVHAIQMDEVLWQLHRHLVREQISIILASGRSTRPRSVQERPIQIPAALLEVHEVGIYIVRIDMNPQRTGTAFSGCGQRGIQFSKAPKKARSLRVEVGACPTIQ